MIVDTDKLAKELEKRWKNIPCPFCEDHNWRIDPKIVTPIDVGNNKRLNLEKIQPLIPVTCGCCGYTAFINALVLGCVREGE